MDKKNISGFPDVPECFRLAVNQTLSSLPDPQKKTTALHSASRPVKILLAAAAICALFSVTVFAAGKLGWLTRIGKYGVGVQTAQTSQSTATQNEYVKLVWHYKPDYLVPTDDAEKYHTLTDGKEDGDGISLLLYTAKDSARLTLRSITSDEPVSLGTNDGTILRYPSPDGDRMLLVNFEKDGYVLLMYVSGKISDEEAVKIASGFELAGTDDKGEAFLPETYLNLAPTDETDVSVPSAEDQLKDISVRVADNNRSTYSGAFSAVSSSCPTFELSVTGARVVDTVDGLDRKGVSEHQRKNIDASGGILPEVRKHWSGGDGINELNEITDTETVDRRLLLIDLTVTNTSGADTEFSMSGLVAASAIDRSVYASYPIAGEEFFISGANGDSGRFRFLPMRAGETRSLTVGYLIDKNADLSRLFFSMNEYGENLTHPAELHFDLGSFLNIY